MSEEEAIKYLINIKDDIFIHLKNYGWIYDISRIIEDDNGIIAIETVLNMLNESIPKQKIQDEMIERKYKLQQEYKNFEDDEILIILQKLLEDKEREAQR